MSGILTKRIKSERKRNYVVIAFDIALIIVFVWWALMERSGYQQGVDACAQAWCAWLPNSTGRSCPDNFSMFGSGQNFSEWSGSFTDTGTYPILSYNITAPFCNSTYGLYC